jgi:hypothetical protein
MRCTIYSPVVDHQAIESVQTLLPGWSLELEGEPAQWSTARFTNDGAVLVFNSLEFTAPQDAFSKILLGTSSYFWRRKDLPEALRKELVQFVGRTRWLIGVVGTSESLPEEFFHQVALGLARPLRGRLFIGTDLIEPGEQGAGNQ